MSNNAYLYNTDAAVPVAHDMAQTGGQPIRVLEVAELPYRVPLPWLLAFSPTDLLHVTLVNANGDSPTPVGAHLALASVQDLRTRLPEVERRLQALGVDVDAAHDAIQRMSDALTRLPLPYLVLNAMEVDDCEGESSSTGLQQAIQGSKSAIHRISGFLPGVASYLPSDLYRLPPGSLPDADRVNQAVALDCGMLPQAQWREFIAPPAPRGGLTMKPWGRKLSAWRRSPDFEKKWLPAIGIGLGVLWALLSRR